MVSVLALPSLGLAALLLLTFLLCIQRDGPTWSVWSDYFWVVRVATALASMSASSASVEAMMARSLSLACLAERGGKRSRRGESDACWRSSFRFLMEKRRAAWILESEVHVSFSLLAPFFLFSTSSVLKGLRDRCLVLAPRVTRRILCLVQPRHLMQPIGRSQIRSARCHWQTNTPRPTEISSCRKVQNERLGQSPVTSRENRGVPAPVGRGGQPTGAEALRVAGRQP